MNQLSWSSLCLTIVCVSCINKTPARIESQIRVSGDDWMFTLVSQETAKGTGDLFEYSTVFVKNTKRFALTTSSILWRKSDIDWAGAAPDFYVLNRTLGETTAAVTYVLKSNGSQFCRGSADANAASFSMPCSDGRIVFLRKMSDLPGWSQEPPIKPSVAFNFWRVGPVYSEDNQTLARVATQRNISFSVSPELSNNPVFLTAFSNAARYWNKAAQREIIDMNVNPTNDFSFDMDRSLIKLHPEGRGAILAMGKFLANPFSGVILRMSIDVFQVPAEKDVAGVQQFTWTLTHELGHALGLAHNFAGSSDPLADAAAGSTTIMDYFLPGKSISDPLPYDLQAMAMIYSGVKPTHKFLLCSDFQSWYKVGCDKYDDPLSTSFEYWRKQLTTPLSAVIFAPLPAMWESVYSSKLLKELLEKAKSGDPEAYAMLASDPILGSGYKVLKLINFSDVLTPQQITELKALEQEQLTKAIEFKIWSPEQQAAIEFLRDQFVNPLVTKHSLVKFMNSKKFDENGVTAVPSIFRPIF